MKDKKLALIGEIMVRAELTTSLTFWDGACYFSPHLNGIFFLGNSWDGSSLVKSGINNYTEETMGETFQLFCRSCETLYFRYPWLGQGLARFLFFFA